MKAKIIEAAGEAQVQHVLLENVRRRGYFKIEAADAFEISLFQAGFGRPEKEYYFARDVVGHGPNIRKRLAAAKLHDWRFDYAYPAIKIAFELDGGTRLVRRGPRGVMVGGRHNNPTDIMKINHAQKFGWRVYRFTNEMVTDGTANQFVWNLAAELKETAK